MAASARMTIVSADPERTQRCGRTSDHCRPVDAERHDDDPERDQSEPPGRPGPADRRQPAQGDHERHRIEEVAVAVLEPAAAVVEQRRDEDGDRRAEQPPGAWPSPVGLRREQQARARDQDRQAQAVGLEERERPGSPSAGGAGSSRGSSGGGRARRARAPVAPRGTAGSVAKRVTGLERRPEADLVVGEEHDERRQDAEAEPDPRHAAGRARHGRDVAAGDVRRRERRVAARACSA